MTIEFSLIISIIALLVSITTVLLSIKQSRIDAETSLTSLLNAQRNKYHNVLHEYWSLPDETKSSKTWTNIMRLELQAYANILEYACIKYSHHHIDRKVFRETFCSSIINFYEKNRGLDWGVDLKSESDKYSGIKKVYKEFKAYKDKKQTYQE